MRCARSDDATHAPARANAVPMENRSLLCSKAFFTVPVHASDGLQRCNQVHSLRQPTNSWFCVSPPSCSFLWAARSDRSGPIAQAQIRVRCGAFPLPPRSSRATHLEFAQPLTLFALLCPRSPLCAVLPARSDAAPPSALLCSAHSAPLCPPPAHSRHVWRRQRKEERRRSQRHRTTLQGQMATWTDADSSGAPPLCRGRDAQRSATTLRTMRNESNMVKLHGVNSSAHCAMGDASAVLLF